MKHHPSLIMLILFLMKLSQCPTYKIENSLHGYLSRTGQYVAVDHLIHQYEFDHINLYKKEVIEQSHLEWNALDNKDLDNYCRRYLHQCVPGRRTWEATGSQSIMKLHYITIGYKHLKNSIVVVTCVYQVKHKVWYHLTRALQPNCVYALSLSRGRKTQLSSLRIVNKHCNFEQYDYCRKKKRTKRLQNARHKLHFSTGQCIAVDDVIKQYELEHQELYKRESDKYDYIHWPFVMKLSNLNEYCRKYLQACVPKRKNDTAIGIKRVEKVQWRSNRMKSVQIIAVRCCRAGRPDRSYYFTRALDPNCVYALLREGKNVTRPFSIIFRHCYFDHSNTKQEDSESSDIAVLNQIPYKMMKSENSSTMETLQLFPKK